MAGFRNDTVLKVKQGLFSDLKKKANIWVNIARTNIQRSFFDFSRPPIDTGLMFKESTASINVTPDKVTISFKNANTLNYVQFPLFGWSTSKNYGARNVLEIGRSKTINNILK